MASVRDTELGVDARQVLGDGVLTQYEMLRNACIGQPTPLASHDLDLSRAESALLRAPRGQRARQLRREECACRTHTADAR